MKKLGYILLLILFFACSKHDSNKEKIIGNSFSIPLSQTESFISLSFDVSTIDQKPVAAVYNFLNGELRLYDITTGKDLFKKTIPLEGPNSIPEHFLVNTYIGEEGVFLVSNAGRVVYLFNKKGDFINKLRLPDFEEDHGYFYFSDGNKLFMNKDNKIYLSYFAGLFPNKNPNNVYNSVLAISIDDNSFRYLAPLPRENVEIFWGEGHMLTGPFGTYSTHYNGLITGFSNSNIVKVYDLNGTLYKEVYLELRNWRQPVPTNIKYEDLANLDQDALYKLRAHSNQQQKVWKILEMEEGFIVEVLEPVSEVPLPRFTVYKFDKDFNFLSTRAFLDDHYTCYQSFVLNNKYHLMDLKAYQEDEDELKFGVFGFEDL